jgi:hypothetical protein
MIWYPKSVEELINVLMGYSGKELSPDHERNVVARDRGTLEV